MRAMRTTVVVDTNEGVHLTPASATVSACCLHRVHVISGITTRYHRVIPTFYPASDSLVWKTWVRGKSSGARVVP